MAANGFNAAYERVRVYEGGNVDSPVDPGGRTSRGITQRVYDAFRVSSGKPKRDVYKATDAEVKAIYRRQYWDAIKGDQLPPGVDMVVFDGAVNSGPKQSVKWLQRALGVTADGSLGMVTLQAVAADRDNDKLIERISQRRMGFLQSLSTWKHFGKGWSSRVSNVTKAAQAMASGSVGPRPIPVADEGGGMKAPETDIAKPMISVGQGTGLAGAGITLESANSVVQQAAGQVQAVSEVSNVLRFIFVGLTILGVALTAYAAWRAFSGRKAERGDVEAAVPDEGLPA